MERNNAWKNYNAAALEELEALSRRYRSFLDAGKTERECVTEGIRLARKQGYTDLKEAILAGRRLQPGDRVYADCMGKSLMLFHIGEAPLEKGLNIVGMNSASSSRPWPTAAAIMRRLTLLSRRSVDVSAPYFRRTSRAKSIQWSRNS